MIIHKKRSYISVVLIILGIFFLLFIVYPNMRIAHLHNMININFYRLQSISKALEAYYIDNKIYPLPDIGQNQQSLIPQILTTPVAYLDKLPKDLFSINNSIFEYSANTTGGWIIVGNGLDKKNNILNSTSGSGLTIINTWIESPTEFLQQSAPFTYDPTNGTDSPGYFWIRKDNQGIQKSYHYHD